MSESFDYSLNYHQLNLRKHPELYKVGRGEQGVLLVEPYKSEILPHWRFKTPEAAKKSSQKILELYHGYKTKRDFIGMDMCRKFLQMGYTRSRRYANHASGKKYDGPVPGDKKGQSGPHGRKVLPFVKDDLKAISAVIFYAAWKYVESDEVYQNLRIGWKTLYG